MPYLAETLQGILVIPHCVNVITLFKFGIRIPRNKIIWVYPIKYAFGPSGCL